MYAEKVTANEHVAALAARFSVAFCLIWCCSAVEAQRFASSYEELEDQTQAAELIGTWTGTSSDPSFSGKPITLIVGRSKLDIDWPFPMKTLNGKAKSSAAFLARVITWSKESEVSDISFKFRVIKTGADNALVVPVNLNGDFHHSHLLRYQVSSVGDMLEVWWHIDGASLEELAESRRLSVLESDGDREVLISLTIPFPYGENNVSVITELFRGKSDFRFRRAGEEKVSGTD